MNKKIFAIVIIFILAMLSYKFTFAFFSSQATSSNNTFSAAESFPQTRNLFVSNDFTCPGGASDTSSNKGTVTISKDSSLDVTAILSGALPNTVYQLWVNQDPGACPLGSPTVVVFISTDGSGNGTNTLSDHPLTPGATKFWVSLVGGTDVLRSTAVSF